MRVPGTAMLFDASIMTPLAWSVLPPVPFAFGTAFVVVPTVPPIPVDVPCAIHVFVDSHR